MRARQARWAGTVAVAVAGSACGGAPPPPVQAPDGLQNAATGNPMDGGTVPDAQLVAAIRRELGRDPVVAHTAVGVDATDGVVNLQGNVESRLAKDRVLAIPAVVRGVRAVVDRIVVLPRPRPDYELDFAVAGALARDPVTAAAHVAARAHQGAVFLSGRVGSEGERRIAAEDVLAIPGVTQVVNAVVVDPTRLDETAAAAAAVRLLRDDVWLDSSRVGVSTDGATLVLSGWVGSPQEWTRAESDARAASPTGAVDASPLRIDRWIDDGTLRARPKVARSDGDLGQALLDAYVRDPRVHPFVPSIDVHRGRVILTGVAPNADTAQAIYDDAHVLPGVVAVNDYMKTPPALVRQSDASVREQVTSELTSDPRIERGSIDVAVSRGRVYLRGSVPSEEDRAAVVGLAASTPGVRDVQDGLVVAPPPVGVTNLQPQ